MAAAFESRDEAVAKTYDINLPSLWAPEIPREQNSHVWLKELYLILMIYDDIIIK